MEHYMMDEHTYSNGDGRFITSDGYGCKLDCRVDYNGIMCCFTVWADGTPEIRITVCDGPEDEWGNKTGRDAATFADAGLDWRDAYREACAAVENSHAEAWMKEMLSKTIEALDWK